MPNMNKCFLMGHLGRDVEVSATSTGFTIGRFSLATSHRRKKGAEWEEQTTWHNVVLLGDTASKLQPYLAKGKGVFVEGRIESRSYDKDGQKRYITEIIADSVQLLGGAGDSRTSPTPLSTGSLPPSADPDPVEDDDIPF